MYSRHRPSMVQEEYKEKEKIEADTGDLHDTYTCIAH